MPFGTGKPANEFFRYNVLNDHFLFNLFAGTINHVSVSPDTTMYASPIVSTL